MPATFKMENSKLLLISRFKIFWTVTVQKILNLEMSNSFENEVIITSANSDYIFTNVSIFVVCSLQATLLIETSLNFSW